jgi:signal peptidase
MATSTQVRILRTWVQIVLIAGIAALLWPASLGGRVDYVMVSGESMEPGMVDGDLVIVRDTDDYEVGDAVAYRIAEGEVGAGAIVIHRITGGDGESGFDTQGDNRDSEDTWHPTDAEVVGEQWVHVPGAGNVIARLRNPASLGILAGVFALLTITFPSRRRATLAYASSTSSR